MHEKKPINGLLRNTPIIIRKVKTLAKRSITSSKIIHKMPEVLGSYHLEPKKHFIQIVTPFILNEVIFIL